MLGQWPAWHILLGGSGQLRNALEPEKGIFIAESPKVIHVALNAGYEPVSLLCEAKHIAGDAAPLLERFGDIPIYTGNRDVLASLTGYTLTRGDVKFGGMGFNDDSVPHFTMYDRDLNKQGKGWLKLYLPARTACVLRRVK